MSQKPTKSTFSTILQDALVDATPEQRDKINEVLAFADAAFCKKSMTATTPACTVTKAFRITVSRHSMTPRELPLMRWTNRKWACS